MANGVVVHNCDYVVNPILQEAGIALRPKALTNPGFLNQTAEAVYDILERQQQQQQKKQNQQGQGGGKGKPPPGGAPGQGQPGQGDSDPGDSDPGDMGGVTDPQKADGSGPADQDEVAMMDAALDGKIANATQAAKAQGKMPAGLERLVVEAMKAKIDWRDLLKKFVAKSIPTDFTYLRPSRRHLAHNLYLPSVTKNGCGKIVVVLDTSGSIGNEEMAQFFGEVKAIFEDCNPEELHLMYCDASVAGHDVYRFGETPVLNPRGGGGTDFRPPFKKVEKEGINPQCLIYITDLYGSAPSEPPPYPTMWICTTSEVAPWGDTVKLEL